MIQIEVYFLNVLVRLVLGVVVVFGVVGLGVLVFVPLLCLTFFNVVLPVDGVLGVVVAFILCTLATFGKGRPLLGPWQLRKLDTPARNLPESVFIS